MTFRWLGLGSHCRNRGRWKEKACWAEEPERLSYHETPRVGRDPSAFEIRIAFGVFEFDHTVGSPGQASDHRDHRLPITSRFQLPVLLPHLSMVI